MHAIKTTQESLVTSKMSYWATRENNAVGLVFRQLLLIFYFFFNLPINPRGAAHTQNSASNRNNTHTKRVQQKFFASPLCAAQQQKNRKWQTHKKLQRGPPRSILRVPSRFFFDIDRTLGHCRHTAQTRMYIQLVTNESCAFSFHAVLHVMSACIGKLDLPVQVCA